MLIMTECLDVTLATRIKHAWAVLRCQGAPLLGEVPMPTLEGQTTGCGNINILQEAPVIGWKCANGLKDCETCPRFEAYRQGMAAGKNRTSYLDMSLGAHRARGHSQDWPFGGAR